MQINDISCTNPFGLPLFPLERLDGLTPSWINCFLSASIFTKNSLENGWFLVYLWQF